MPRLNAVRKRSKALTGYLNKSNLGRGKAKVIIGKEAAVTQMSKNRGMFGHFCDLENVHSLSEFKHDTEQSLCLDPLQSTEGSCLKLTS